jgi:hypothetical protein
VERASLGSAATNSPSFGVVTLASADRTDIWLLAEAWCAEAFTAPTYAELVSWSIRALPWSLSFHRTALLRRVRATLAIGQGIGAVTSRWPGCERMRRDCCQCVVEQDGPRRQLKRTGVRNGA